MLNSHVYLTYTDVNRFRTYTQCTSKVSDIQIKNCYFSRSVYLPKKYLAEIIF